MRSREITQKTRLYALFFFAVVLTRLSGRGLACPIAPLAGLATTATVSRQRP
jgi:hypothetical protein